MSDNIAEELDELLEKDQTLTTRTGMRFLAKLTSKALKYIDEKKEQSNEEEKRLEGLEERFANYQKTFDAFLSARKAEQDKAEEERKWWRRAMLAPVLAIMITELVKLIFNR